MPCRREAGIDNGAFLVMRLCPERQMRSRVLLEATVEGGRSSWRRAPILRGWLRRRRRFGRRDLPKKGAARIDDGAVILLTQPCPERQMRSRVLLGATVECGWNY